MLKLNKNMRIVTENYEVEFSIEFVDDIGRAERGKYLYLIQKSPVKF